MRYVHQDHLGSTSVITDDTGAAVYEASYDPWGNVSASTGTADTDRLYTGQRFDAATGLYYYNARYYDPTLARFISPDTIVPGVGNPQAWNRYAYVLGNPLRYVDPSGKDHRKAEESTLRKLSTGLMDALLKGDTGRFNLLSGVRNSLRQVSREIAFQHAMRDKLGGTLTRKSRQTSLGELAPGMVVLNSRAQTAIKKSSNRAVTSTFRNGDQKTTFLIHAGAPDGKDAITLGSDIISTAAPAADLRIGVLAHEIVHVEQALGLNPAEWFVNYLANGDALEREAYLSCCRSGPEDMWILVF